MTENQRKLEVLSLQIEIVTLREQNAGLIKQIMVPQFEALRAQVEAEDRADAEAKIAAAAGVPAASVQIEGLTPQG
jgi:hypothetical protein